MQGEPFESLAEGVSADWQYEGKLVLDNDGERYFVGTQQVIEMSILILKRMNRAIRQYTRLACSYAEIAHYPWTTTSNIEIILGTA